MPELISSVNPDRGPACKLTQERLKELFTYYPETGVLMPRKVRQGVTQYREAGTIRKSNGYRQVCIDRKLHYTHRLAFLYMDGFMPELHVDHINGNKLDNKFCNLRLATRSVNAQNMRGPMRHNSTGYLGVTKASQKSGFVAKISVNGKRVYLGTFEAEVEAHEAYLKAKRNFHEGCTI